MAEFQVCLDDVLVWNLIHRQQVRASESKPNIK